MQWLLVVALAVARATAEQDGLLVRYRLDEVDGTTVQDSLGDHDGVYIHEPELRLPGALPRTNTSVLFGTEEQQYVSVLHSETLVRPHEMSCCLDDRALTTFGGYDQIDHQMRLFWGCC